MLKIEAKINAVSVAALMREGVECFDGIEPLDSCIDFYCSQSRARIGIAEARDLHRALTIVLKAIDSEDGSL